MAMGSCIPAVHTSTVTIEPLVDEEECEANHDSQDPQRHDLQRQVTIQDIKTGEHVVLMAQQVCPLDLRHPSWGGRAKDNSMSCHAGGLGTWNQCLYAPKHKP